MNFRQLSIPYKGCSLGINSFKLKKFHFGFSLIESNISNATPMHFCRIIPPLAKGGEGGFNRRKNPPHSPFFKGGGSGEHYQTPNNTFQNRRGSHCITFAVLNNFLLPINSLLKNSLLQVAQKGPDTRRLEIPRNEAYIEIRRSDEK